VQYLPLSAAKPWFKALMVCQPIEGHHGATARCCTAVSGRRTSSLNLYDWRKPIGSVPVQRACRPAYIGGAWWVKVDVIGKLNSGAAATSRAIRSLERSVG